MNGAGCLVSVALPKWVRKEQPQSRRFPCQGVMVVAKAWAWVVVRCVKVGRLEGLSERILPNIRLVEPA